MSTEQDRARAVIYGMALGDALGYPLELLSLPKITTIYGEAGIQEPHDPARFSDETQTTVAVSEALIEAGSDDIDSLMQVVTRNLVAWSISPENTRAPGHTVTESVRGLEAGIPWAEAGNSTALGNGSANRMATIGYFYQHDPVRLREVAHAVGIATHAHPAADASSIAAAYMVKLALDGISPENYIRETLTFVGDLSADFVEAMERAEYVLTWNDEAAAIAHIGDGWIAPEAIAMAAYCAIRFPYDYPAAVQRAVNIAGDSDSVGSMAGGISAARVGLDGIPVTWVARLESLDALTDLADRLAARKEELYA